MDANVATYSSVQSLRFAIANLTSALCTRSLSTTVLYFSSGLKEISVWTKKQRLVKKRMLIAEDELYISRWRIEISF